MDCFIERKSWLWNLVPLAGRKKFSTTIGNKIYLTPERYDDFYSKSPSDSTIALVEHEKVHVLQKSKDKWFSLKYVFSRKARFKYEVKAYAIQIDKRMQLEPVGNKTIQKMEDYCERYARYLSSWRYMLFMSFDKCFKAMEAVVVIINKDRNRTTMHSIFTKGEGA